MVTRVIRLEMPKFQGKNQIVSIVTRWLLIGYSLVTRYDQTFPTISTKQI